MFSLYIHIPFCEKKCNYCSFYIVPTFSWVEEMKNKYLKSLKNEILQKKKLLWNDRIHTIYIGWWTPCELGLDRTLELFNFIFTNFNLSNCQEISFELNPNPLAQSLEFIEVLSNLFSNFRFSVWIQSVENAVLKKSWRNYNAALVEKFMDEVNAKNCSLNLDFISFWIEENFSLFDNFLQKYSWKINSLSVYTLELFSWSVRADKYKTNEDKILENFEKYLDILTKYDYKRYEISNFSKKWKESKHNQVYWQMWDYIGIWVSASSFINRIRYTNAPAILNYNNWIYNYSEEKKLTKKDFFIEKIFLNLRTSDWLKLNENVLEYIDLQKLQNFINEKYLQKNWNTLFFTNKWFFLYNYIITDILKEI